MFLFVLDFTFQIMHDPECVCLEQKTVLGDGGRVMDLLLQIALKQQVAEGDRLDAKFFSLRKTLTQDRW